jgi:hypothetical protein
MKHPSKILPIGTPVGLSLESKNALERVLAHEGLRGERLSLGPRR